MTAKQMSTSQIERFIRSMEEQDVGITRTTKGLLLRLPDGESTSIHFTNSDVRAEANIIARLRRAGVRHPDDKKSIDELPAQITSGDVAKRTKEKVMRAIEELGYPTTVRVPRVKELTGLEHVTTSRALYHMGFRPTVGKRNVRDWLTPAEILDLRPQDVCEDEPFRNPGQTIAEGADPEWLEEHTVESSTFQPVGEQMVEDIEFLDERDSWVPENLMELLGPDLSLAVTDRLSTLTAVGMGWEIRVWRK